MLHQPTLDDPISLKQVEFNTISSSFGTLSQQVAGMHRYVAFSCPRFGSGHPNNTFFSFRYLIESTGYFGISPLLSSSNLPSNDTTRGLAEGLAGAHRAYGVPECVLLKFLQTSRALIQPRVFAVHTYFSSSSPMSGTYSINAC